MLYLDAHEVEEYLAQHAILEVEHRSRELELYMQAVLYANLHLDRLVLEGHFLDGIIYDELLLLGDLVVIAIDYHVDEVPQLHDDAIVTLELLLHAVERERILDRVRQHTRRLQLLPQVYEVGRLAFVEHVLDDTNELHSDTQVIHLRFALQHFYLDLPANVIPIL